MPAESLADVPEGKLVAMMLTDPGWGLGRILNIHGFPERPRWRTEVPLLDVEGGKGDVDVLLASHNRPESAVAIQAKRIKVGANALRTEMPNGLQNLHKLRQQANHVARLGLEQVYAYVFVVVDSRSVNVSDPVSYVGMQPPLRNAIQAEAERLDELDDRVGLVVVDATQSMDHPPLTSGFAGVSLIRKATAAKQRESLTRWVAEQLSGV